MNENPWARAAGTADASRSRMPAALPWARHAAITRSRARMNVRSSIRPGMPIECDRSAGPTNSTSTPSIDATASAASTAAIDSTWNTPRTRSFTVVARSPWRIAVYPAPRVEVATPRMPAAG